MTTKNDLERARKLALIAHAIATYEEREESTGIAGPRTGAWNTLEAIAAILGECWERLK